MNKDSYGLKNDEKKPPNWTVYKFYKLAKAAS